MSSKERDIVDALVRGEHASFESQLARVEMYRFLDSEGEGFSMLITADNGGTREIEWRTREEAEKALSVFGGLGEWEIFDPYPDPEFPDESTLELMYEKWREEQDAP